MSDLRIIAEIVGATALFVALVFGLVYILCDLR